MKFLSVQSLLQGVGKVLKRFPLEVLFALTGTIAGIVNVENNDVNYNLQSWCWRITAGANLGLLLSLSATLYAESRLLPIRKLYLLRLAAIIITAVIVADINPFERVTDVIRFFLLSFAFHLLVAFAAFMQKGMVQAFWQFNKTLFLRFLASALYSAVLFLGLAAAIAAANFLFGFDYEWDSYVILWISIVGMFSTIFFLAGVPVDVATLDQDYSYPKALKVFTQYVLIPLATVYVFILLAYEIKIIVEWQLPQGMVSRLVLGYAVFGILSILLVYPIRNQEDNKWLKTYAKSFYLLLLPLIVLLFVATGTRVFKYGVTEFRYFLILLSFWLLFVSLYFLFSRKQNIKVVPVSLALLTLLAVYGPLSAFSVSKSSQLGILQNIFKKNKAYKDGYFAQMGKKVSAKEGNHAVATLNYLVERHDLNVLQPYFKQDLAKTADSLSRLKSDNYDYYGNRGYNRMSRYQVKFKKQEWIKKRLNLQAFSGYWNEDDNETVSYTDAIGIQTYINVKDKEITGVKGYDYLVDLNLVNTSDTANTHTTVYQLPQGKIMLIKGNDNKLNLKIDGQAVVFDLEAWAQNVVKQKDKKFLESYKDTVNQEEYIERYKLPADRMFITQKAGKHTVTLKINELNFYREKEHSKYQLSTHEVSLLIKW